MLLLTQIVQFEVSFRLSWCPHHDFSVIFHKNYLFFLLWLKFTTGPSQILSKLFLSTEISVIWNFQQVILKMEESKLVPLIGNSVLYFFLFSEVFVHKLRAIVLSWSSVHLVHFTVFWGMGKKYHLGGWSHGRSRSLVACTTCTQTKSYIGTWKVPSKDLLFFFSNHRSKYVNQFCTPSWTRGLLSCFTQVDIAQKSCFKLDTEYFNDSLLFERASCYLETTTEKNK